MSTSTAPAPEFTLIALSRLRPSKTNPRQINQKDASFVAFVGTIKEHGIQTPLLVRPVNGHYEIVAGERRFTAAKQLGLDSVPAIVRDLSDEQARDIELLENLQREDISPLAEADAYHKIVSKSEDGCNAATAHLAATLGKDMPYIVRRLKLRELAKEAREGFESGVLLLGHLELLCRLQPDAQREAVKWATETEARHLHGKQRAAVSVQALKSWIDTQVHLDLTKAPFDILNAKLLPKAGACDVCPKRTGNNAALFPDVKAKDTCTDPYCYQDKVQAHLEQLIAETEKKHPETKVVRLSTTHWLQKKPANLLLSSEWREITKGEDCKDTRIGVVVHRERYDGQTKLGTVKKVCIGSSCKVHSRQFDTGRSSGPMTEKQKGDRKRKIRAAKIERGTRRRAFEQMAAHPPKLTGDVLRVVAFKIAQDVQFNQRKVMLEAVGLEGPKKASGYMSFDLAGKLEKAFGKASDQVLTKLIIAALCTPHMDSAGWNGKDNLVRLADACKIKMAALRTAVTKELDAKKPASKKKA